MFEIAVVARTGGGQFLRIAHAHQIACNQPPYSTTIGHDVAPDVGTRWISMLKTIGAPFPSSIYAMRRPLISRNFFSANGKLRSPTGSPLSCPDPAKKCLTPPVK